MKTSFKSILCVAVVAAFIISCIPARQFEEVKKKKEACETENAQLKTENQTFASKMAEQNKATVVLLNWQNLKNLGACLNGRNYIGTTIS